VAIIAGLAAAGLNFVKVQEKVVALRTDRDNEKDIKEKTQKDLASTKTELKKTSDTLKQTKATLDATTEEKNTAVAEADRQTKRADRLSDDLKKANEDRDTAQTSLNAFVATGYTPQQIVAAKDTIKNLNDELAGTKNENKLLGKKIDNLQAELDRYRDPFKPVLLPAGLKGKILVTDPKWNFVVLDVGENQGVREFGELLVNRNGKLVAKVVVRTVQKDRCIANVVTGWQLGDVMEGDQVIPAHPASS
jgi:uncharacterized protein YoxC